MVSLRDCPHCPATYMNYRTKKGDYYCRACKNRFPPPRTVIKPTRNRPTRAFTKARGLPIAIKDHKTHEPVPTNKASVPRRLRYNG